MRIELREAAIGRGVAADVPPLSLTATEGTPTVVAVDTAERPLLVSLLIAGRIAPDSGTVTLDGADDRAGLRERCALVDTPTVAEPHPGVALSTLVAEELAFAHLPSSRAAVRDFLDRHGLGEHARVAVRTLPAVPRIRVLSALALARDGVEALVITSPERHGGDIAQWYAELAAIAERGTAVVIVTDSVSRDILVSLGARESPAPHAPAELESPQ
jgi:ABC-2 type transport system ATP-binding protein